MMDNRNVLRTNCILLKGTIVLMPSGFRLDLILSCTRELTDAKDLVISCTANGSQF